MRTRKREKRGKERDFTRGEETGGEQKGRNEGRTEKKGREEIRGGKRAEEKRINEKKRQCLGASEGLMCLCGYKLHL